LREKESKREREQAECMHFRPTTQSELSQLQSEPQPASVRDLSQLQSASVSLSQLQSEPQSASVRTKMRKKESERARAVQLPMQCELRE